MLAQRERRLSGASAAAPGIDLAADSPHTPAAYTTMFTMDIPIVGQVTFDGAGTSPSTALAPT